MTYRGNSARSYNPITGEERVFGLHGARPSEVPQIDLDEVPHEAPSYRSAKSVHVERQIDNYQQMLNKMSNQKAAAKPEPAPNVSNANANTKAKAPNAPVAQAAAKSYYAPQAEVAKPRNQVEMLDVPRLSLDDENQNPVDNYGPVPESAKAAKGKADEYPHLRKEFETNFVEYHFPYVNSGFSKFQSEMDGQSKSAFGYSEIDRNNMVEATLNEHLGKSTRVAQHGELSGEERSAMRTVLKQTAGLSTARLNELQRTVTKKELNEERVRFSARLVGFDDREALKDLTGYYFPLDCTLLVYEFCSHLIGRSSTVGGKLDRTRQLEVLPFLKRFAYLQRTVNLGENTSELSPVALLDVFVGNTLYIPVNDKESNSEKVLCLRIVSVDEAQVESHIETMYSSALNAKQSHHDRILTLYYFRALSQNILEDTLFYRQFQRSIVEAEQSPTRLQTWALLQFVAKQSSKAGQRPVSAASHAAFDGISLADLGVVLREMGISVLEADLHRFFMGLFAKLQLLRFGCDRIEIQEQVAARKPGVQASRVSKPTTKYVELVDVRILMRHLFGETPEWRKTAVRRVFQRLDPRRTGSVSLIEAIKAFNPASSLRQHYDQFLNAFTEYARTCARAAARLAPRTARSSRADIDINDVRVTFFEFELYYDSLSAARFGVADATLDAEFIKFVNSCWQSIL